MEFEDQVLGQMGFVAPDDPANSDVGKTKFVASAEETVSLEIDQRDCKLTRC